MTSRAESTLQRMTPPIRAAAFGPRGQPLPPEDQFKTITARAHRLLEVFLPNILARDLGADYDVFRKATLEEAVRLSIDLEDEVERQMTERAAR